MANRIFLFCLFLAGCTGCGEQAKADEWTVADTAWETGFTIAAIGDWIQTDHIADCPDNQPSTRACPLGYREIHIQRIIGEHPSRAAVNEYFTAVIIGHIFASNLLPVEYKIFNWSLNPRRIWQITTFSFEADQVHHNLRAGVKIEF
jgi:hypothetical protein